MFVYVDLDMYVCINACVCMVYYICFLRPNSPLTTYIIPILYCTF